MRMKLATSILPVHPLIWQFRFTAKHPLKKHTSFYTKALVAATLALFRCKSHRSPFAEAG